MEKTITNCLQEATVRCKRSFIYIGLFSCVINLLMLTLPIYMLQIFDRVLASFSGETLLYLTLIAVFLMVVFGVLHAVRSHLLVHLSAWLDQYLSPEALSRAMDEVLRSNPYAALVNSDITSVRQFLNGPAVIILFDAPWIPLYLFVIFLLHPWLGVLATVGAIVLFVCAFLNERLTEAHLANSKAAAIQTQQQDRLMMNNADSIQAMGMLPAVKAHWGLTHEESLRHQTTASQRSGEVVSASKAIRMLIQILMLGLGAYLVILHELTPGMMIAGSILVSRALAPIEQAISAWRQVIQAREAYHRLQGYFASVPPRTQVAGLPKPHGVLTVNELFFHLPNREKPILSNIHFQAKPGEMIVIAGHSAAGKSTLAKLLVGVYPATRGSVRLDGADIYQWDRTQIGRHIGYLPQRCDFFLGTVRQNIARMQNDQDPAVIAAAKLANTHQTILALPEGYDTSLTQGGSYLSGGQRQQIALTRALFGSPQYLVLDEPSTGLDTDATQHLLNTLQTLRKQGKTLVVITHQMAFMKAADRILWLKAGEIALYGPTEQVFEALKKSQATPPQTTPTKPPTEESPQ